MVAVKNVTVNEEFFQGHFPGDAADAGRADDRDARAGRHAPADARQRGGLGRPRLPARRRQRQVPAARSSPATGCGSRSRSGARRGADRARAAVAYIDDTLVAEAELLMGLVGGAAGGAGAAADRSRPRSCIPARASAPAPASGRTRSSASTCASAATAASARRRSSTASPTIGDGNEIFPFDVDRPDPAGPEVRRRADPAGHRRPQRDPRVRDDPSRHRRRRRASPRSATTTCSWPTRTSRTTAMSATTRSSATPRRSAGTSPSRTTRRSARSPACTSSAASGKHAFIGGYSVVTKDALPFAKTVGNRARIYGLNTIGLVRRKFSPDSIAKLRRAYRILLHSNTSRALAQIEQDPSLELRRSAVRRGLHPLVEPRRRPAAAEPRGVEDDVDGCETTAQVRRCAGCACNVAMCNVESHLHVLEHRAFARARSVSTSHVLRDGRR